MIKAAAAGQLSTRASAGTGGHLHDVAENRDRPEAPCRVGQTSRNQPQAVAEQFAEAGNHPDHGAARRERSEERPEDAARAFVGEIGEEAEDANQQDEAESSAIAVAFVSAFRLRKRGHDRRAPLG
jgi:hypothetical protein